MNLHERALLCEGLLLGRADSSRARALSARVDWDVVCDAAEASAVLPTLAYTLDLHGALPERAAPRERLGEALAHNAMQNRILLHDLAEAVGALRAAGVESIVLKGAALLAAGHVPAEARHVDDIDLLVQEQDIDVADETLARLGYTTEPHDGHEDATLLAHHGRASHAPPAHPRFHFGLHGAVQRSPNGTPVELHRYAPGSPADRQPTWAARRARVRAGDCHGVRIDMLEPHDLFIMACEHVIVHHHGHPKYLARHLVDVVALGGSLRGPWSQLEGRTRESVAVSLALLSGARGPLAARFAVSQILFARPWMLDLHRRARHYQVLLERFQALRDLPVSALAHSLFPERRYMAWLFDVPEDSPWLFALYPYRLLRAPLLPFLEHL